MLFSLKKEGNADTLWISLEDIVHSGISNSSHMSPQRSQVHRESAGEQGDASGGGERDRSLMGMLFQCGKMRKCWMAARHWGYA